MYRYASMYTLYIHANNKNESLLMCSALSTHALLIKEKLIVCFNKAIISIAIYYAKMTQIYSA